jgi:hypothetical protein
MQEMKRYQIELTGNTPLLMHQDNVSFGERVRAWQKDPANKGLSVAGDDRSPAWVWIGYAYHDGRNFGMPSDNLMTMLREGGAKVNKKGKETFKKYTQSGVMLDQQQFDLLIDGKLVPVAPFKALIGNNDFTQHLDAAEAAGFELLVKRAVVGRAKHVRVRPMFRTWSLVGSLTVLDEDQSGLSRATLQQILDIAGALCGLGDWRPSSGASGTFGRFSASVKPA